MSRHGVPTKDMIEFLMNCQKIEKKNEVEDSFHQTVILTPMKTLVEKIEFPLNRSNSCFAQMDVMSTLCKSTDEDWEPLPADYFSEQDLKTFGGQQLPVHSLEYGDASFTFDPEGMLEPTPFRESTDDMSRLLLEPLSPEIIDDIF